MTKGKIVLLPFPFDNLSGVKVRPAVCLTEPIGQYNHIIVSFITSRIPNDGQETDILIDNKHLEFSATGLKATSVLRLHRLMTIAENIIRRELGELPNDLKHQIDERLKKLFEL
jgi:mRNA interferase MazF